MLTESRLRKVLSVGESIYIRPGKCAIPSVCTGIDVSGINTEHDHYSYEEHGKLWCLTERVANEHNPTPSISGG